METIRNFWRNFRTQLWDNLPNGDDLANILTALGQTLIVTLVTLYLARRIRSWVSRLLGRSRLNPNLIALAGNGAFLLVLSLGVTTLLRVFGAGWTPLPASLSAATVAVGLALQDLLRNVGAGIYILIERPFKIGDRIDVKGITGEVEGIDFRTTVLRTDEGLQVLVPNAIVFTEIVTNRSAYDTHRVTLHLDDVRAEFKDLSRLVNEALAPFEPIERAPAPKVTIQRVNDDSTKTVALQYWQRGNEPILPDVLARLKDVFPEADITIKPTAGAAPAAPAGTSTAS